MLESDAEYCRRMATECEEMAAKAVSQAEREAWLRLAADWIKLAQRAEQRSGPHS
jgi:hypothetical protein